MTYTTSSATDTIIFTTTTNHHTTTNTRTMAPVGGTFKFAVVLLPGDNVSEFVKREDVKTGIKDAMAKKLGIKSAWITVRLSTVGRLRRRLSVITQFFVHFEIAVPSSEPPATAALLKQATQASLVGTDDDWTNVLESSLRSSTNRSYTITPQAANVTTIVATTVAETAGADGNGSAMIVAILLTVALCGGAVAAGVLKRRGASGAMSDGESFQSMRSQQSGEPGPRSTMRLVMSAQNSNAMVVPTWGRMPKLRSIDNLLNPPDAISFAEGQAVRSLAQDMVADACQHDPLVCVTYATGNREEDASGFGPGTFYAAAVLLALTKRGIPCFSGLMIPPGEDRQPYLTKLEGACSTKILIVIQTVALYDCKQCLMEIDQAQKTRLFMIPVLFEPEMPNLKEQWPEINKNTDAQGLIMKMAVKREFSTLNSVPSPPNTIPSKPEMLNQVISIVDNKLRQFGVRIPTEKENRREEKARKLAEHTENDLLNEIHLEHYMSTALSVAPGSSRGVVGGAAERRAALNSMITLAPPVGTSLSIGSDEDDGLGSCQVGRMSSLPESLDEGEEEEYKRLNSRGLACVQSPKLSLEQADSAEPSAIIGAGRAKAEATSNSFWGPLACCSKEVDKPQKTIIDD